MHIVPAPEQDNQPLPANQHLWEITCKYTHTHNEKMGTEETVTVVASNRTSAEQEAKRLAATEVFGNDLHRRYFMVTKSVKKG
ncbi:hypothetical protein COU16_02045 [Candidatus Kaiserbacteria bacterium CG10_big_fil_rev_8_21_14_0_10_47_16]|uniref:Uncharacterized protein n=1 Tax=Candidatus Kaiserbacteria bacterium CG10_big_fil_rev_8_21_14_0_10_47_16 TaxID=1974608 RepID=A0A2H0UD49_9BACT|nr:MAG: hypothetical protein COU16_02045 [Candidatus Kaiserbacteria bacterium CG10_big_fil_rev_8_21_14_0_10_47_16]